MAEIAVHLVLDRLITLFSAEVDMVAGLKKEVEDIRMELEYIARFLREADSRAGKEEYCNSNSISTSGLNLWVKHVREIAYEIEDVIDEYMLHVSKHHDGHGIKASLAKKARLVITLKTNYRIASNIKHIKTSIQGIKERSERYGFNTTLGHGRNNVHTHPDPRMGLHFVENDALVGIDSSRQELASRLVDVGVVTRTVISVVGMGGVGKTTLAKRVFDHVILTGHFDCHAWITVSQSYTVEELLRTMIKRIYECRKESPPLGIATMDGVEMISKCREYLRDKRYVVVFDDVWKEDFWRDIEYALLDNKKGSKILMTTRSKNVAEFCKRSSLVHVHNLEPLPLKLSQELLCKTAFHFDQDKQCPQELMTLSFDIVKRCQGLPLAIVAIGGLLATKGKDPFQWKHLLDSLSMELDSSPHLSNIKNILCFSYYDLPYHLKACFLSLGMYPEDYSIRCKRIVRTWIAKGFVKAKHGMTLEQVGMEYLTDLINRSLVQVSYIDYIDNVRNIRLHDLMREVILSKSEELSFVQTSPQDLADDRVGVARYRSIYSKANNVPTSSGNYQTHSVVFFDKTELPKSLFTLMFTKFKLLRELDFEEASLNYIPEEVGNLLHLKYLSLRNTKVKRLPNSIGKLHNLQTLDLKHTLISELPVEINKLLNLQYLVAYHKDKQSNYNINTRRGVKIHGNLGSFESLEKLYEVDMEASDGGKFCRELGRMYQLRKLCITKLKSENGKDLCDAIQQMVHLQSLRVSSITEQELLQLQSISTPPSLLRCLRLRGRLAKLPDWISQLTNLAKLTLEWSRISDDSLQMLGLLPKLLLLCVYEGYNGGVDQLHFQNNQFKKLKELHLVSISELKRLIIDDGALPLLEQLGIGYCHQLEEMPSSVCDLRSLKTLTFTDMSEEFARKLLPNGGSDHWKVKHVPTIYFLYNTLKGSRFQTYKLGDPRLVEFLCHSN